jgi:RES domain-containing protein
LPAKDLVDRVDALGATSYEGAALRHVAPGHDPLATAGARIRGGRWNPPESFGTLYLALDRGTVITEFHRLAARHGLRPEDFLPRDLHHFRVKLEAVLDLRREDALEAVGLDVTRVRSDNRAPCQAIGEAAHYLGLEAVLAPSATGSGDVLAVFFDRLRPESLIEVSRSEVLSEP